MLEPLIAGDRPAEWLVLQGLSERVGKWVDQYLDAQRIASIITTGMPIEGQPPLVALDEMCSDCAAILGLPKPQVYVRRSAEALCYAGTAEKRPILVLTSGMISLFEDRPHELRFIIGRELGHLKCEHEKTKVVAFGVLVALQAVTVATIPDSYREVAPTLALGRLFDWSRESEISADRAGLMCCQDRDAAIQALMRLMHGLKASNSSVESPIKDKFDPGPVLDNFDYWLNQPLVKFSVHLKQSSMTSPFLPERIAALQRWIDSGEYNALLTRSKSAAANQLVVIRQVSISSIGPVDEKANPYLLLYDGNKLLGQTVSASDVASATWKSIDLVHAFADNQPIFVEIWDDSWGSDELLGGFVIYPQHGQERYTSGIVWDWKERTGVSRRATARMTVSFREREE